MATPSERLTAGEMVAVEELLAELRAPFPKTCVFERWCEQRGLPSVVMDRVSSLLRALEKYDSALLDDLILGLECNQPGISGGMAYYRGD